MITGLRQYEEYLVTEMKMERIVNETSTVYRFHESIGSGYIEVFKFHDNFQIWITEASFHRERQLEYNSGDDAYIGISYVERAAGDGLSDKPADPLDVTLQERWRLTYPVTGTSVGLCPAKVPFKAVNLFLDTGFFHNKLPHDTVNFDILRIIQVIDPELFLHNLNPFLAQMLYCPLVGSSKFLFLWGKVLEVAAQLVHIYQQETRKEKIFLSSDDKELLRRIPAVLSDDIANPPSIPQLARQLTINEYKLKAGFKQLYGVTIFEYLRKLRMEKALVLLAGDLPLLEVADTLGYKSLRGFNESFTKYSGITPKGWRAANRRI